MPKPFIHTTLCLIRPENYDEENNVVDLDGFYCLSETKRDLLVALREIAPPNIW